MIANPVLRKLGYSDDEKVVIIHTDDIGMCQASVAAFKELWAYGLISSGATMVPCSWFPEVANICRNQPEIDLGVHITLTSEWDSYRWSPISTCDPKSGLIDNEGYFFRRTENVQRHGNPEAVWREIKAQIDRALEAGIDITHIDTHMGAVASMKFIPSYVSLAREYKLPPMIMRHDKDEWLEMGMDETTADLAVEMISQLEEEGIPLIDQISSLDLDQAKTLEERIAYADLVFSTLDSGITHFIIHPSTDTRELRAITPDWMYRVADYNLFKNKAMKKIIKDKGIQVIGYRSLKALMG